MSHASPYFGPIKDRVTMTRQTVDDLHDDAKRIDESVEQSMQEWESDCEWGVEYEIPAETNGWIYYGDMGAPATCANWGDQWPSPNAAVGVFIQPTHPQNESKTYAEVFVFEDMDNRVASKHEIDRFVGEEFRTPLYVRRRIFWQAVGRAIEWMETNPASSVSVGDAQHSEHSDVMENNAP